MIVGKQIRLRAIEADDIKMLTDWRNNPKIYRNFFEYEPLSQVMERKWFERFLERRDEKFWIAETVKGSKPVGSIALVDIHWRSREVEMGRVLVCPEYQGQGYGREICLLALGYAFNHMNLNRVYLQLFADNSRAVTLYRSLGFRDEGCLREHVFSDGRYCDVLIMGILREEYLEVAKRIQDSSEQVIPSDREINK